LSQKALQISLYALIPYGNISLFQPIVMHVPHSDSLTKPFTRIQLSQLENMLRQVSQRLVAFPTSRHRTLQRQPINLTFDCCGLWN